MSTEEEHGVALKKGAMLNEYRLDGVLGVGGFGVTYLALDTHLDKKVVIKEFLPNEIAIRQEGTTVLPKSSSDKEGFEWGLDRFLQEAKVLAKFNHPNIVKVSRFFKENGTAYFVMDYEEGEDLESYIKQRGGTLEEDEIKQIMLPILDGLREVHSHDFLHRDIKPGNIYIRKNGSPMLIDFGASRYALSSKSKSLTQMLTPGYAPIEQYSSDASKQGAYTDIYAIGAVMYKMISAQTPAESQDRSNAVIEGESNPYTPIEEVSQGNYTEALYKSINTSLELSAKKRPQSVKELQELMMEIAPTAPIEEKKPAQPESVTKKSKEEPTKEKKSNKGIKIAIAAVLVVLVSVFAVNLYLTLETERIANEKKAEAERQEQKRLLKAEKLKAKQLAQKLAEEKRKQEEAAKYRTITIRSNVNYDSVYVNGSNKGSSPVEVREKIGETLKIQIKKDGYRSASKQIKVKSDKTFKLKLAAFSSEDVKKFKKFLKGAQEGDSDNQVDLGFAYEFGQGVDKDGKKAVYWYRKAADQGNKYGQANLSNLYRNGKFVKKDYQKSLHLARKAADQGFAQAQGNLGYMYEFGLGVSKNNEKALYWYLKSAEQGNSISQGNVGNMYLNGIGVDIDNEIAVSWYRKAAKQGDASAQSQLGYMYDLGLGVEPDKAMAVSWYRKAAKQGNAIAQSNLGNMYKWGTGVNKDRDMAIYWLRRSAKQGNKGAKSSLTKLGETW